MVSIFQYLSFLLTFELRIVVTLQFVVDVLHVLRVEHPDYLNCEHLGTMSKDKMISAFGEQPANWGDR